MDQKTPPVHSAVYVDSSAECGKFTYSWMFCKEYLTYYKENAALEAMLLDMLLACPRAPFISLDANRLHPKTRDKNKKQVST